MFFHISTNLDRSILDGLSSHVFSESEIQLDAGWTVTESASGVDFRKGYSIQSRLGDIDPAVAETGNYCVIQYNRITQTWRIYYDDLRGFPIYYSENHISNLDTSGTMLVDKIASIVGSTVVLRDHIEQAKHSTQYATTMVEPISDITKKVKDELWRYIDGYVKYNDTAIVIADSKGYDSTALRAIMDGYEIPYALIENNSVDTGLLSHVKKKYWGYRQSPTWSDATAIMTGFWGNEVLMRAPRYVAYYLKQFGIDYKEVALSAGPGYMSSFIREYIIPQKIMDNLENNATTSDLISALYCDHQMWHFDNNITITPFKNLKLIELGYSMSIEDCLDQSLNVRIQHNIINELSPNLLLGITKIKEY